MVLKQQMAKTINDYKKWSQSSTHSLVIYHRLQCYYNGQYQMYTKLSCFNVVVVHSGQMYVNSGMKRIFIYLFVEPGLIADT